MNSRSKAVLVDFHRAKSFALIALLSGMCTGAEAASTDNDADPALRTLDLRNTFVPDADFDKFAARASSDGVVHVIVTFQVVFTPEGRLSAQKMKAQRASIAQAKKEVKAALSGTQHQVAREYISAPAIALSMTSEALRALQVSGLSARLQENTVFQPILASSGPIVESTEAAALGRTGSGRRVAVLDTGVDKDHAFIGASQVSNEACFAAGSDGVGPAGDCPNGSSSQIGPGSGEDCTFSPADCRHGTHVAGIAIGGLDPSSPGGGHGVAREARVIPVQVFSNFGFAGALTSDLLAGLEYILGLPVAVRDTVASVNMSLGGACGPFGSSPCGQCDDSPLKLAIDNLRSVGIATVIASGNNSFNNGVSNPGCISTAVTVGATDDADNVAGFSNSSPLVDMLAIGVSVTSSVPNADPPPAGSPPYSTFNGTSMATPMIAAAFAVLDQVNPPGTTVAQQLTQLQDTGLPVTDPDNGVTKSRLRLLAATGGGPPTTTTTTTTTTTLPPTTTTTTTTVSTTTTTTLPPPGTCNGLPVTIVGTNGSESITGTAGDDVIDGLGGNDVIRGLAGNDVICGGSGQDRLNGGPDLDTCNGGPGTDTAVSCESTSDVP